MATKQNYTNRSTNYTLGIILLAVGSFILLRRLGIWFPGWFFSFPMALVAVGIVILVQQKFQSAFGYVILLIGGFFLIKREIGFPHEVEPYLLPIGLIILGTFFILNQTLKKNKLSEDFNFQSGVGKSSEVGFDGFTKGEFEESGDVINSQALFSSDQRRIISKNFKGGKVSAIMGGVDIDFSSADIPSPAALNVEVAFGGVKLVVPAHWDVRVNVTNIFAGVEDKRVFPATSTDPEKILHIYGSVMFGGLEIKSF
ncbi:LiaF transmembrane domain-containing protein [Pararhodonellum marinum]|uniref:LiaF transmembrane domain-containing protein n=1 Tax=Pararhodonellum marinum TaxID=2755358 RepID=UPI0018903EAF|nr:LiaF domain-containing protein [Pararhodonellum marinum]